MTAQDQRLTDASQPRILVTGSSGIVGSAVCQWLDQAGARYVTTTRSGESLELGRVLDFENHATFDAALAGIERVFLMRPPALADMAATLLPFIDAAHARGVQQVVFLSLQGVQGNRSTPHYAVEQHLRASGMGYTFLRPNFFMQNLSGVHAAEIRDRDEIFVPAGRSRTAFIDARDIGRVAAVVLTQSGHLGKAYTLSGEQSLSYAKIAALLSRELGRTIRYDRPSESEYLDALRAAGSPEDYIAVQRMIYRVVRLNISAFPNRSIRRLTGEPATTFAQFAHDARQSWIPPS